MILLILQAGALRLTKFTEWENESSRKVSEESAISFAPSANLKCCSVYTDPSALLFRYYYMTGTTNLSYA